MNKFTASADRIQTLFIQRVLYNRTDSHKEIHMLIYSKDFFFLSFLYWAPIDPLSKSSPAITYHPWRCLTQPRLNPGEILPYALGGNATLA